MTDVTKFMQEATEIDFRYLIFPHKGAKMASGIDLLTFTPEIIEPMIAAGKEDGLNAIKYGNGKVFNLMKAYMEDFDRFNVEYPSFQDYAAAHL